MAELNPFQQAVKEQMAQQASPFAETARAQDVAKPSYSYSVLPLSEDAAGKIHFDTNAGLVGSLKRSFMAPGEAMAGTLDPNSHEGTRRIVELALGALPANRMVRAGQPARALPIEPPTAEALTQAGKQGYKTATELGVDYHPRAINILGETARVRTNNQGLNDVLAPKTHKIIDMLTEQQPAGAIAPFSGLRAARMSLRKVAQERNEGRFTPDAAAAAHVLRDVDRFLENPPEAAVMAGPAAEAGQLVKEANANYAAGLRSGKLAGIEDSAELRAAAANSGKNLDNNLRQRAAAIVLNPKARAGFSEDELKLIREVAEGNFTRNRLRDVGNLLGGGGGLGALAASAAGAAGGGAMAGPAGAGVGALAGPIVGQAARYAANRLTSRALTRADEATRSRSPLFEQMQAAAPQEAVSTSGRMLGARAGALPLVAPTVPPQTFADMIDAPRKPKRKKR